MAICKVWFESFNDFSIVTTHFSIIQFSLACIQSSLKVRCEHGDSILSSIRGSPSITSTSRSVSVCCPPLNVHDDHRSAMALCTNRSMPRSLSSPRNSTKMQNTPTFYWAYRITCRSRGGCGQNTTFPKGVYMVYIINQPLFLAI